MGKVHFEGRAKRSDRASSQCGIDKGRSQCPCEQHHFIRLKGVASTSFYRIQSLCESVRGHLDSVQEKPTRWFTEWKTFFLSCSSTELPPSVSLLPFSLSNFKWRKRKPDLAFKTRGGVSCQEWIKSRDRSDRGVVRGSYCNIFRIIKPWIDHFICTHLTLSRKYLFIGGTVFARTTLMPSK